MRHREDSDTKITYRYLSEEVYDRLKREILTAALPAGSKITAGDVAAKFGVSRTPAKDAISRLAMQGLLKVCPRVGTFVALPDEDRVRQVFQVRKILELGCIGSATLRLTSEQLSAMEEKLRAADVALSRGNTRKFVEADRFSHDAIIAAADNSLLVDVMKGITDQVEFLRAEGARNPQTVGRSLDAHWRIYRALLERNVPLAAKALEEHLDESMEVTLEMCRLRRSVDKERTVRQGR